MQIVIVGIYIVALVLIGRVFYTIVKEEFKL